MIWYYEFDLHLSFTPGLYASVYRCISHMVHIIAALHIDWEKSGHTASALCALYVNYFIGLLTAMLAWWSRFHGIELLQKYRTHLTLQATHNKQLHQTNGTTPQAQLFHGWLSKFGHHAAANVVIVYYVSWYLGTDRIATASVQGDDAQEPMYRIWCTLTNTTNILSTY